MKEARKAQWNPKGNYFNETANRLIEEGFITLYYDRYYVTEKGLKESQ